MRGNDLDCRGERLRSLPVWLVAALCFAGCTSKSTIDEVRKPVHPVKGKVFVAGKPAVGAFVLFTPVNEPADSPDPRPRAEVQGDGSFDLFTYEEKDGAPAGDYKVTVLWPGSEESDRLQGRYADASSSKLRAKVKDGPNELPPFQLR